MPHLGQLPGCGLRTSGCIGQVYSAAGVAAAGLVDAADTAGLAGLADTTGAAGARASCIGISAMPHFGQLPGASCTISGCIGQV
jgi:hypothetical protein